MRMTPEMRDQLRSAYAKLTSRGIYPGMPDADSFAQWFWDQENELRFDIGCPDFSDRRALVYGWLGLQRLCGVERKTAVRLLRMAIAEIEAAHPAGLTDFSEIYGVMT
jgi:hypothetical protein